MLDTKFWTRYFTVYDYLNELIPYQNLLNSICYYLKIKKDEKILDLGSGTGNLSIIIEKYGAKVTSLDFSKEGIDIHKKKNPKAHILYHDITFRLPFDDGYFDSIVTNNVLYTIPRELRLNIYKELYRVLKKSGKIVSSNLIEGFSAKKIYFEHLKMLYKKFGLLSVIIKTFKLIIPTVKIFYYNYLISKENEYGKYDFFNVDEQREQLALAGFLTVSEDIKAYSDQAIINVANK